MLHRSASRLLCGLAATVLVASACGSSSGTSEPADTSTSTGPGGTSTSSAPATTASTASASPTNSSGPSAAAVALDACQQWHQADQVSSAEAGPLRRAAAARAAEAGADWDSAERRDG